MKKKYILSGMAGAVSVAAIAAVLGTPFFTEQMSRIQPIPAVKPVNVIKPVNQIAQPVVKVTAGETSGSAVQPVPVITPPEVKKQDPQYFEYIQTSKDARKIAIKKPLQEDGTDQKIKERLADNEWVVRSKSDSSKEVSGVDQSVAVDRLDGHSKNKVEKLREMEDTKKSRRIQSPSLSLKKNIVGGGLVDGLDAGLVRTQSLSKGITGERTRGMGIITSIPSPAMSFAHGDEQGQSYYKDVGRDKFEHVEESPVKVVTAEPVSTFSIDVDTASYTFTRKKLNQGVLPQKDAVRVEEMINYFDYNYPVADSKTQPFKPTIAVYDSPWKAGNKIFHIGIKGYDISPDKKPKSNLVFLLDVSGSMNSPDKLPLLKNSLKMLLDSLNPEDTVGIVVYAGSAGTVLEPTKAGEKHKILEALERLKAGGSTAGAAGIRQAYNLAEQHFVKEGVNRVILATDGDFNVGITNHNELKSFIERKRDTGISLSVLGFGKGNYNDSMMQILAQNGNGNAAYIDTLSEARKVLVQEASSTLFTIAKDVKLQVEFNPAAVKEYRLIGYETRALKREDFNNDKVDAGEIGSGHSVTALYEITPFGAPTLVDDLRYGEKTKTESKKIGKETEYAFLKIRYKLPKENFSQLIKRSITVSDEVSFDQLPDDIRFAASVAGFGQILKGGKYTGNLTYDQVIKIANKARGNDEFGYRTEFVNLVRLAKSAAAMQP